MMANIDPITKRDLDEVSRIEKNMRKLNRNCKIIKREEQMKILKLHNFHKK